ncbi:MAG: carbonic anhydrase, partial [Thermodesulfobacteriota bacterium]
MLVILVMVSILAGAMGASSAGLREKPRPDEIIGLLAEGNERFATGQAVHPRADSKRLAQAGREDQGDHALATILACSDSRVPVELIFDAGIMDIFVVRVAGAVCGADEAGSIEYGLAHVHTPVLVVLGHTQCGAVTAVTKAELGEGHPLERNIPPLIAPIFPAVKKALSENPHLGVEELVAKAV